MRAGGDDGGEEKSAEVGEDGTEDVYAVDRAPSGREGTAGNGCREKR